MSEAVAESKPPVAHPVLYEKRGVRIVEVFFDHTDGIAASGADIVRYRDFSQAIAGTVHGASPTLHVDLQPEPPEIQAQMRRRIRRKLKEAATLGLTYEFDRTGDAQWAQQFYEFFDRFAPLKQLPAANRERIEGMRAAGVLFLSRIRDTTGEVLVWHAYYFVHGFARLFHSASLFRAKTDASGSLDREFADRVAVANAQLHWCDMQKARSMGCHTYDFGSWHAGQDPENLRINEFKEGFGGTVVELYSADEGRTMKGTAAVYARRVQGVLRGNR